MGSKDPRVDIYIANSAAFAQPILLHLRELVHTHCPDVAETIKWSMPHFDYRGGIFCGMAAFKAYCTFGFWLGALLKIETRLGDAMGQFGCITTLADLPADNKIAGLIKAAMKLHDAGAKLPKRAKPGEKKELEVPPYFLAAVKRNKKAHAAFAAFSPSKKREYVEWIVDAKTDVTRDRRLKQAVEWMSEGKARNWKYANC